MDSYAVPPRALNGDFAGWLRDEMTARRMTARMLGLRAGVDHTTVYRLAIGERQPSLATAVRIIRVLATRPARGPFHAELRREPDETVEAGAD